MNPRSTRANPHFLRPQGGFTLVELMVTVAIALFLIGGLLTVLQNVRGAYNSQQLLSQLQDQQRFSLTVLSDVIQAGGYFPDATAWQPTTSLPASTANGTYVTGQAFFGTRVGGTTPDTIDVRYRTAPNDGVILCDGSTNTTGATRVYVNQFTVANGALQCQLFDGTTGAAIDAAPVQLVNGVSNLVVYYGVKRNAVPVDYNIDTYLTADQMNTNNGTTGNDWTNISSVLVRLSFANPLFGQPGQAGVQPQTINLERVIEVMSRAGPHT